MLLIGDYKCRFDTIAFFILLLILLYVGAGELFSFFGIAMFFFDVFSFIKIKNNKNNNKLNSKVMDNALVAMFSKSCEKVVQQLMLLCWM